MSDILIAQEVGTVVVIETAPAEIVEVVAVGPQGPVGDVNPQMPVILAATEAARDAALVSELAAATSQSVAATSAANAATSESNAATSAATATAQATASAGSATASANSATSSANSATAAQAAQTATESARDTTLATIGTAALKANNLSDLASIPTALINLGLNNVSNTSDANKPISTATQAALDLKENAANKGVANGYAALDAAGLVPATQLPSYVDDVLEYANLAAFPVTGEAGKIYVALDTNKTYRWSGSTYIYITSGAVDSVAGKTGVVVLAKADVGLGNVDNTSDANKPVSTAQQSALNLKLNTSGGTITANASSAALTITQTGTGNAFVVEDSTSPDTSPFVIDADGRVIVGSSTYVSYGSEIGSARAQYNYTVGNGVVVSRWSANQPGQNLYLAKSRGAEVGTRAQVALNDILGTFGFVGDDGTSFVAGAKIASEVDSAPAVGSMPGRLVFSTTPNGSSSPVESLRIDSKQNIGKGGGITIQAEFDIRGNKVATSGVFYKAFGSNGIITDANVTDAMGFGTYMNPGAGVNMTGSLTHFGASQRTFAGTALAQRGFEAQSSLIGATLNYGFYGAIPAGTGRYNFYAAGTAANYFAGETSFGSNVTIAGNLTVTDPVVQQSDIGSAPNKIPLNLHLGQLAYADTAMVSVPASATANGLPGQIATDQDYLYVCVAVNTWKRTALTTW